MKLNEYQQQAMQFAQFSTRDYPFIGLSAEAGEVADKLAKAVRKYGECQESILMLLSSPKPSSSEMVMLRKEIAKELGDVLWMVQGCAGILNYDLEEIAQMNIDKLQDRQNRGVIVGSGDNR